MAEYEASLDLEIKLVNEGSERRRRRKRKREGERGEEREGWEERRREKEKEVASLIPCQLSLHALHSILQSLDLMVHQVTHTTELAHCLRTRQLLNVCHGAWSDV